MHNYRSGLSRRKFETIKDSSNWKVKLYAKEKAFINYFHMRIVSDPFYFSYVFSWSEFTASIPPSFTGVVVKSWGVKWWELSRVASMARTLWELSLLNNQLNHISSVGYYIHKRYRWHQYFIKYWRTPWTKMINSTFLLLIILHLQWQKYMFI